MTKRRDFIIGIHGQGGSHMSLRPLVAKKGIATETPRHEGSYRLKSEFAN